MDTESLTESILRRLSSRVTNGDAASTPNIDSLGSSSGTRLQGLAGTNPQFWQKVPLPPHAGSIFLRLWRLFPDTLRLFSYRILCWMGKLLYPSTSVIPPTAQRLPFNLYCKYLFVNKSEILATIFVAQHTAIPVPQILDVIESTEGFFVLMTRLPGVPSAEVVPHMNQSALGILQNDIHNALLQLRSLPIPPSVTISNFIGGGSLQHRIASSVPIGPFSTVKELHDLILSHVWGDHRDQVLETANRISYSKGHRVCFTHGDLRPWNVLVHNGRLSGLVDFGSSGWFPEYWEHASAMYCTPQWWQDMFFNIFPQYQDENDVEDLIFSVTSTHPQMW